jgi:hypothetical protein
MEERIDFALEPGVILFAVGVLVVINVLLAAVLYPYFKGGSDAEATEGKEADTASEEDFDLDSTSEDDEHFDERVDEFLEDVRSERVE